MKSIKNEKNNFRFKNIKKKIVSKKKRKDTKRQPYHQQGGGVTFSPEKVITRKNSIIEILSQRFTSDKSSSDYLYNIISPLITTISTNVLGRIKGIPISGFLNGILSVSRKKLNKEIIPIIETIINNLEKLQEYLNIDNESNVIFIDPEKTDKENENVVKKILELHTESGSDTEKKILSTLYKAINDGNADNENIKVQKLILIEFLKQVKVKVTTNEGEITELLRFQIGDEIDYVLSDNKRRDSDASTASMDSFSDESVDEEEFVEAEIPPIVNRTVSLIPGEVSDQIQYGDSTLNIEGYCSVVNLPSTKELSINIQSGSAFGLKDYFFFKGYEIEKIEIIGYYVNFVEETEGYFSKGTKRTVVDDITNTLQNLDPVKDESLLNSVINLNIQDNTFKNESGEYKYKILGYQLTHRETNYFIQKDSIKEIIEELNKLTYKRLPFYPSDYTITLDEDNKFTISHSGGQEFTFRITGFTKLYPKLQDFDQEILSRTDALNEAETKGKDEAEAKGKSDAVALALRQTPIQFTGNLKATQEKFGIYQPRYFKMQIEKENLKISYTKSDWKEFSIPIPEKQGSDKIVISGDKLIIIGKDRTYNIDKIYNIAEVERFFKERLIQFSHPLPVRGGSDNKTKKYLKKINRETLKNKKSLKKDCKNSLYQVKPKLQKPQKLVKKTIKNKI